ncbi:MAG: hypothetical protein IIC22_08180 [Chloroflexi bacterium]|nr:hypothetical protein [Chloroflexota bacterium]
MNVNDEPRMNEAIRRLAQDMTDLMIAAGTHGRDTMLYHVVQVTSSANRLREAIEG